MKDRIRINGRSFDNFSVKDRRKYHRIDKDESMVIIVSAVAFFSDGRKKFIPFSKIVERIEIKSVRKFLKLETGADEVNLVYLDQLL